MSRLVQPEEYPATYLVGKYLIYWTLKSVYDVEITGRGNIPRKSGLIVAPNHISHCDPPVVGIALGSRPTYYMAKHELFEVPIFGEIIPRTLAFPVHRGTADRAALKQALDLLKRGALVTIFPEGQRSHDGRLQKPELGISLVALKSRAPVLPMAIAGTNEILPPGASFLKLVDATIRVRIGCPLTFEDLYDRRPDRAALEEVGRRIMDAIRELQEERAATRNPY